jgi:hypothetical protein
LRTPQVTVAAFRWHNLIDRGAKRVDVRHVVSGRVEDVRLRRRQDGSFRHCPE